MKALSIIATAAAEFVLLLLVVLALFFVLSGCNLGGQILITHVYQASSTPEEVEQADGQLNPIDEEGKLAAALSGKGTNVSNIFIGGDGDFGGVLKVPLHAPGLSVSIPAPAKSSPPTTQPAKSEPDADGE